MITDLKKEMKKLSEAGDAVKTQIAACEEALAAKTLEADAANEALYALKIEQTELTAKNQFRKSVRCPPKEENKRPPWSP